MLVCLVDWVDFGGQSNWWTYIHHSRQWGDSWSHARWNLQFFVVWRDKIHQSMVGSSVQWDSYHIAYVWIHHCCWHPCQILFFSIIMGSCQLILLSPWPHWPATLSSNAHLLILSIKEMWFFPVFGLISVSLLSSEREWDLLNLLKDFVPSKLIFIWW